MEEHEEFLLEGMRQRTCLGRLVPTFLFFEHTAADCVGIECKQTNTLDGSLENLHVGLAECHCCACKPAEPLPIENLNVELVKNTVEGGASAEIQLLGNPMEQQDGDALDHCWAAYFAVEHNREE